MPAVRRFLAFDNVHSNDAYSGASLETQSATGPPTAHDRKKMKKQTITGAIALALALLFSKPLDAACKRSGECVQCADVVEQCDSVCLYTTLACDGGDWTVSEYCW